MNGNTRTVRSTITLASVAVLWLALPVPSATADTIFVGPSEPITSVEAGLAAASSGDVVLVRPGTYNVSRLNPPSGVSLVGERGPTQTRLFANAGGQAFFLDGAANVRVEGFDIYSVLELGPRTNALFYIESSSDIVIRDCYLHDAPNDADVVKMNSSVDVLIESTVIWNPGSRTTSTSFQENIDIRGAGDMRITVRGCWLFQEPSLGDYLIYAKGGTTDLLWENNIFGPSAGAGSANVPVESGHISRTDPTPYDSENFVIRNNLFVGLRGTGAFAFAGPRVAVLANNVFYRNENIRRSLIELTANRGDVGGPGIDMFSLNNIFFGNGDRTVYRVRDLASAPNLTRDFNVYETGTAGGDLSLADETSSALADDPLFVDPAIPSFDPAAGTQQIARALERFRTLEGSPARGAGTDVVSRVGAVYPGAIAEMATQADAFGTPRLGGSWDVGLFESCTGGCMCGTGRTDCGGACVDTSADDAHCGGCSMACSGGDRCVAGACVMSGADAGAPVDAGTAGPDAAAGPDAGTSSRTDAGATSTESGCTVGSSSSSGGPWIVLLLAGLLFARRARR